MNCIFHKWQSVRNEDGTFKLTIAEDMLVGYMKYCEVCGEETIEPANFREQRAFQLGRLHHAESMLKRIKTRAEVRKMKEMI